MRIRLSYTQPQLDIFFPAEPCRHTIIAKGRRFGATHGAANACIEWMIEGMPILWGDTVHGNVIRYVDRYFMPTLKANGIEAEWKPQEKLLRVGSGYIDFRSADRPENWEGFGYRKIVLNEAGIILSDPYLYTNAVRPMMLDFPQSEMYALGVPKGKKLRNGQDHPFHSLYSREGTAGYRCRTYSSYDNPMLSPDDIAELERDMAAMDPEQVRQEIYGEFIDRVSGRPFAYAFDRARHVRLATPNMDTVRIGVDFNLDPFCVVYASIWTDASGHHCHIWSEDSVTSGTVQEMGSRIRTRVARLMLSRMTGDYMGTSRRIGMRSNRSLYDDLLGAVGLSHRALDVKPNPPHVASREQLNYVLTHHPDFCVDPSCEGVIHDLLTVEADDDHSIIKANRQAHNQRADMLDCVRYLVNTYLSAWIEDHRNAVRPTMPSTRPRPMSEREQRDLRRAVDRIGR